MQLADIKDPLIVIIGPTAVGKTELSLQLAERLNGEIISSDSRLFYRGMDIGTAKPDVEERQRVPHHLIDVAEPDEVWSLALFQRTVFKTAEEIYQRNHLPFLVGGTGQYVRAVIEGWEIPPQKPDLSLRNVLDEWAEQIGSKQLHQKLALLDPKAAEIIDYRNVRRTVRALEVIFHSGRRFSQQRQKKSSPFSLLIIGLNRDRVSLYQRVDERIEKMLEMGFLDEVRALKEKGYSSDLPTLSAIGYREMLDHLEGNISLEEAVTLMKRKTRQFVRRQANWFKLSDPRINWFDNTTVTAEEIEQFILSGKGWIIKDSKQVLDNLVE